MGSMVDKGEYSVGSNLQPNLTHWSFMAALTHIFLLKKLNIIYSDVLITHLQLGGDNY